jgi:integrase
MALSGFTALNDAATDTRSTISNYHFGFPIALGRVRVSMVFLVLVDPLEVRPCTRRCARWQRGSTAPNDPKQGPADAVCFLDVPVNKTGTPFTKPVDALVGQAIEAWEKIRPSQGKSLDSKTGELVDFLFFYRMARGGDSYLNNDLIPLLCQKAGVPPADVRGKITGHRARSTIASQLFNAKSPMTLYRLQEWMGHSSVATTQYYAMITPTRLLKSYSNAATSNATFGR